MYMDYSHNTHQSHLDMMDGHMAAHTGTSKGFHPHISSKFRQMNQQNGIDPFMNHSSQHQADTPMKENVQYQPALPSEMDVCTSMHRSKGFHPHISCKFRQMNQQNGINPFMNHSSQYQADTPMKENVQYQPALPSEMDVCTSMHRRFATDPTRTGLMSNATTANLQQHFDENPDAFRIGLMQQGGFATTSIPQVHSMDCREPEIDSYGGETFDDQRNQFGLNYLRNPSTIDNSPFANSRNMSIASQQHSTYSAVNSSDIDITSALIPPRVFHVWHYEENQDIRTCHVHTLLQEISPQAIGRLSSDDPRRAHLLSLACDAEISMYEYARSKEEYFYLLAEEIFKVRQGTNEMMKQKNNDRIGYALHGPTALPNQVLQRQQQQIYGLFNTDQATQQKMPLTTPTVVYSDDGAGQMLNTSQLNCISDNNMNLQPQTAGQVVGEISYDLPGALQQMETSMDVTPNNNIFTSSPPVQADTNVKVRTETSNTLLVPFNSNPTVTNIEDSRPEKVFYCDGLINALMPVIDKLFQDPASPPFHCPVNAEQPDILDYHAIVKQPMDLSTIRKNLEANKYTDPWEFINDVWLMFENAWLHNRKISKVYKCCTKLKDIFEQEIGPVMRELGYCCGQKLDFTILRLHCHGKTSCTISSGDVYYEYQNKNSLPENGLLFDNYHFCKKCFNGIKSDSVPLNDKLDENFKFVLKCQFEKKKNDVLQPEPFVQCEDCCRKLHQICVLHHNQIWPKGFVCDNCHRKRGTQRKPNQFKASMLPHNKLSKFIEERVNDHLKCKDVEKEAGYVHIRTLYSGKRQTTVKPEMKAKFVDTKEMSESFPYHSKAFYAFQEVDGVDVCFFGAYVQEYDSDAPPPNTRSVYLSYMDSVNFFRPKRLRTSIYHEILIGYFEYCKYLGYEHAHIWASPPTQGDDYIFNCHPPEQKIPEHSRLQKWYTECLDKAKRDNVVVEYNIFKPAKDDRLQSACEIPYFDGDYWPNAIEKCIKELEEERKQAEANEQAALIKGNRKMRRKKYTKKASQRSAKRKIPKVANNLNDKLYQIMAKDKENFFSIRLQTQEIISKLGKITDPDPLIDCDLMDSRDSFWAFASKNNYEFSSLRRAKFATMALVFELHKMRQDTNIAADDLIAVFILKHASQCLTSVCDFPDCATKKADLHHIKFCKKNKECEQCKKLHDLCLRHIQVCQVIIPDSERKACDEFRLSMDRA